MNLEGKYTELHTWDAKSIITFLFNNGYKWSPNKYDLKFTIDNLNPITKFNNLYLMFLDDNTYVFNTFLTYEHEYVDIRLLIREEKLKRILKTKPLLK